MHNSIIWLAKLILAHLISDFALQKDHWIIDRNQRRIKSKYLYLHIAITAVTSLIFIGFPFWKTVVLITVTHYLIDLAKSYLPANFTNFIVDQGMHIAIIFLCWGLQFDLLPTSNYWYSFYSEDRFWIYAAAVFFLIWPSGFIVDQATKQWQTQLNSNNTGLFNAGKYIGIIERLIISFLVYNGQYEAIGLLITGKSILRYNSTNEEVKTEYLLVGTLISMSLAFAVGILLKYLAEIKVDTGAAFLATLRPCVR